MYTKKISQLLLIFALIGTKTSTVLAADGDWIIKSPESTKLTVIETAPWGILAGENDSRLWLQPFNGIYISDDFGDSWDTLGMENRGITDISYDNEKIYASSYYFNETTAGLFMSEDKGETWNHLGNNFSALSVDAKDENILIGTYSHGLWKSNDGGNTWSQTMGDGTYGPKVYKVTMENNLTIASLENSVHISRDNGNTWLEISELSPIRARSIETAKGIVFLGTENDGVYRSTDDGISWYKLESWGDTPSGAIKHFDGVLYAGKENPDTGGYDIHKSADFGETWESINLPILTNGRNILSASTTFSNPSYLFALAPYDGIYRYQIPKRDTENYQFLEVPWETATVNEIIERIYSFFDHEYPISNEPDESSTTTLNFLGRREGEPLMYYSGHAGTDYIFPYGKKIVAPSPGYANYTYNGGGLGNSITIDHLNGYKTVYGHLLNTGLVTTSGEKWINTGEQVGLVGSTGISTGPHLHFSVTRNEAKVDPYGWQAEPAQDPWEVLSGTKSLFLWNTLPEKVAKYLAAGGDFALLNNKKIIVEQNSSEHNFTIFVEPYAYPKVPISQNKLTYISGTSMLVNAYNLLGEKIPPLFEPSKIEIDISGANLDNILENSLKIYFWNEEYLMWESIPSVFDAIAKKITGTIDHFSRFAVFGEKSTTDGWSKIVKITDGTFSIQ